MSSPLAIGVVIACYDLGRTVEEAVDSALAQTRPPAEVVIVDDGSPDVWTRQILSRLNRPRTRVARIPHGGVALARNHGVGLTRSPYVVLLDADDALADTYLERLGARLDAEPALGFVSCAVQAFEGADYVWTPPSTTALGTLTRGSVHVSSMFRRTVWDTVGGFDAELPAYEDLDFWLRAIRLGFPGEILDEALLLYRVRAGSRYRRGIQAETYRPAMRRLVDRHRAVLDQHGIDVLTEKASFLLDVTTYHARIRRQRDALLGEIARVDEEIAAARRSVGDAGPSPAGPARATPSVTAWADSALKRQVEDFLAERRWLVRGRVGVFADRVWALDGLTVPRWDDGAPEAGELRRPLDEAGRLSPNSLDCAMALVLAPTEAIAGPLKDVAATLKPGGTLIVASPAAVGARVAEDACEPHPGETALRSALAPVFPLDAFDVETHGDGLVTACVRRPGGARLPRLRFARRTAPRTWTAGGVILAYHRVAALAPDTHGLCVAPERFREHVRYLRTHCTPMALVDLWLAARAGALPPRAVAVTFDDGYLDALTTAAPILAEVGVPATFFVNTERLTEPHEAWHDELERMLLGDGDLPERLELGLPDGLRRLDVRTAELRRHAHRTLHGVLVGATADVRTAIVARLAEWSGRALAPRPERRVLLADEIVALARLPGCEIGSHSEHHLLLPGYAEAVQRAELRRPKERLEALLDRAVLAFAYPFGQHSADLQAIARDTPHLLAVTVEPGLVTGTTDPMRMPRLEVTGAVALTATLEQTFGGDGRRPATGTSGMSAARGGPRP